MLVELPERVGQGTVRATLAELAGIAVAFYEQSIPMAASLFAEPALLTAYRERLRESGAGPQQGNVLLAAYVRAEQERGRISPTVDPAAVAALLLGACHQRAFLRAFLGEGAVDGSDEQFAAALADTLLAGAAPA